MHRPRTCPVSTNGVSCGHPVIASHSQQRKGPLKEITEAGHVVGFSNGPNAKPSDNRRQDFAKVSAKRASTFPGLCAKHDATVFSEIENKTLNPSYRNSLGLAIRCTLYEAIVHTDAGLFLNWLREVPSFEFWMDPTVYTDELEHMAHYARYNWDLVNLLQRIESKKSTRKLFFYSALIDAALPFSSTGCFCIENDIAGNQLQPFSDFGRKFSYAQLTIMPQSNGTTLLSVSSTNDRDRDSSWRFVKSYAECKAELLPNAILRTALEYTENTYFRPSWINSLNSSQKKLILERFDDRAVFEVGKEKPHASLAAPLDLEISGTRVKFASNVT